MLFLKNVPLLALVAAVVASTFQSTNADTFCGYLNATANFATLLGALEATDLSGALEDDPPSTLFAPTDEAFAKVPLEILKCIDDAGALPDVLKYHVVKEDFDSTVLTKIGGPGGTLNTLQGEPISVSVNTDEPDLLINNSTVELPFDVDVDTGTIHALDTVLIPPELDLGEICTTTTTTTTTSTTSSTTTSSTRKSKSAKSAQKMGRTRVHNMGEEGQGKVRRSRSRR